MGNPRKLLFQVVVSLIVVLACGWMLGGTLNLAAIVSPQAVTAIDCPAGSTASVDWVQQSFDQPGQKTMVVTCHQHDGTTVTPLSDAQSQALEYRYFFPAGVVLMALAVIGFWFAKLLRRQKSTRPAA